MSDTDAQKSKIFLPITNLRNIAQLRKNINEMKSTEIRGNTYSITINEYYPQQRAAGTTAAFLLSRNLKCVPSTAVDA